MSDQLVRIAASLAALCVPALAEAQVPPQVQNQLPSRQEVQPPAIEPDRPPSTVRIDSKSAIATAPCPLAASDLKATITAITFSGAAKAPLDPRIASLLEDIAATPPAGAQPLAEICEIRDRATAALRAAGYLASVQIPPQRLENGVLQLEVITARIVEVRVRGDLGAYRGTLQARIDQLKKLDPLNQRDAERILLLADDVPGLDVSLALRPAGRAPGEVIGDLTITFRPFRILANVQNYGSRQLGRETGFVRAEVYGLTGASDMTYIGAQSTLDFREQQVVQAGHVTGLGSNGLTLAIGGTYAWSRPSIPLLDLRARSILAEASLSLPLVRTIRRSLYLAGGFDFVEQRTRVFGAGATGGAPLNRDRIRTAFLRASGVYRDLDALGNETFRVAGGVELRKGLDILGATRPQTNVDGFTPSRFEGNAAALVMRGDLAVDAQFGRFFSLGAVAQGQWSDAPLLNYDEFSLGNLSIGRGYDPGSNSGDHFVGLRGEARVNVLTKPTYAVRVFAFYDQVWLWNLDSSSTEKYRHLGSFGGGVRAQVNGRAALDVTYARPRDPALLLTGARRPTDRILFSLTVQFAPGGR